MDEIAQLLDEDEQRYNIPNLENIIAYSEKTFSVKKIDSLKDEEEILESVYEDTNQNIEEDKEELEDQVDMNLFPLGQHLPFSKSSLIENSKDKDELKSETVVKEESKTPLSLHA